MDIPTIWFTDPIRTILAYMYSSSISNTAPKVVTYFQVIYYSVHTYLGLASPRMREPNRPHRINTHIPSPPNPEKKQYHPKHSLYT